MIELRFYRERYNMNSDYYTGDHDIYCRLYFKTLHELEMKWKTLFNTADHWLEGETYSAWYPEHGDSGVLLCGGAFDPGDIEYIANEFSNIPNRRRTYRIKPEFLDNRKQQRTPLLPMTK